MKKRNFSIQEKWRTQKIRQTCVKPNRKQNDIPQKAKNSTPFLRERLKAGEKFHNQIPNFEAKKKRKFEEPNIKAYFSLKSSLKKEMKLNKNKDGTGFCFPTKWSKKREQS